MLLAITAKRPPISLNADGVALIAKTRVTLDTIVNTFKQGVTAEEIVYRYPSLKLADTYAAIAFYLNNQDAVEQYLRDREKQAAEVRKLNESRLDAQDIRERLLARKNEKEAC